MCKMLCPEGEEFHPLANCECRSVEEIREVYPDWASDLDIQYASDAGMDRFWKKKDETPSGSQLLTRPGHWPKCLNWGRCEYDT